MRRPADAISEVEVIGFFHPGSFPDSEGRRELAGSLPAFEGVTAARFVNEQEAHLEALGLFANDEETLAKMEGAALPGSIRFQGRVPDDTLSATMDLLNDLPEIDQVRAGDSMGSVTTR